MRLLWTRNLQKRVICKYEERKDYFVAGMTCWRAVSQLGMEDESGGNRISLRAECGTRRKVQFVAVYYSLVKSRHSEEKTQ